jgi:hypothetical protein
MRSRSCRRVRWGEGWVKESLKRDAGVDPTLTQNVKGWDSRPRKTRVHSGAGFTVAHFSKTAKSGAPLFYSLPTLRATCAILTRPMGPAPSRNLGESVFPQPGPSCARLKRARAPVPTRTPNTYAGWTLRIIFFQSILFQSILVRNRERISMNRKMSSNPREAVGMDSARLGSKE